MQLYKDINKEVRRLFDSKITISEISTTRAIYFHGFLLEQTLMLFDINPLEKIQENMNTLTEKEMEIAICREILLLPTIIIAKENFYSSSGKFYIFRSHRKIRIREIHENRSLG